MMNGPLLPWVLVVVLGGLLVFCLFDTQRWSLGTRLLIGFTRLTACWVMLIPLVLLVFPLSHVVSGWSSSVGQALGIQVQLASSEMVRALSAKATVHPVPIAHDDGGSAALSVATGSPVTHVERIYQLDPRQYRNQAEYEVWADSTCSTTSMTEVLNAYGDHYRITDVLAVEREVGAISPQDGLLSDDGIARTMRRFGFGVQWGHDLSLDQVIAQAQQGVPVIVDFPPGRSPLFEGGHILLVVGGDGSQVRLVDSSAVHLQALSRSQFLQWWNGFSAVPVPPASALAAPAVSGPVSMSATSVLGGPSLSAAFIDEVLAAHHSPAAGTGWALYALSQHYGIDDAFALAFFWHESNFGTQGEATITRSLGNLRCIPDAACADGDYAAFPDWPSGYAAWYQLIAGPLYMGDGRTTVQTIIPRYAPAADNNDEQAYIDNVVTVVAQLRAGHVWW